MMRLRLCLAFPIVGSSSLLAQSDTLNGPIYTRGAAVGDMLEIRIRSIDLRLPIAGQGFVPTRGALPEEFPKAKDKVLHPRTMRVIASGPTVCETSPDRSRRSAGRW
jgi:acetamidase/formamidase